MSASYRRYEKSFSHSRKGYFRIRKFAQSKAYDKSCAWVRVKAACEPMRRAQKARPDREGHTKNLYAKALWRLLRGQFHQGLVPTGHGEKIRMLIHYIGNMDDGTTLRSIITKNNLQVIE